MTYYIQARYRIAGNFRGRKLSQICKKYNCVEKTFADLLAFAVPKDATPQISQRKLLCIAIKPQNSRTFSPSKVPRYTVTLFPRLLYSKQKHKIVVGIFFSSFEHHQGQRNTTTLIASGCVRELREAKRMKVRGNLQHIQLEPIKVSSPFPCDQFARPAMSVVWSGRG